MRAPYSRRRRRLLPSPITDRAPPSSFKGARATVMHIESGRVWLAVIARGGTEAICGFLGTGAILGEEALAQNAYRATRVH